MSKLILKGSERLNFNCRSKKHYANMSVQYTAIFHSCKNDNFQMKVFDIFLIFAQNIDCGYSLEPPQHRLCVHVKTASARRF